MGTNTPPQARPPWVEAARRYQIESVRAVSASLVEVRPDSMYDVAIHLRDGKTITLRMYALVPCDATHSRSNIGPTFPASPPTFQLMCRTVRTTIWFFSHLPKPLVHPLLGQSGVVLANASPRLMQWNSQNTLGSLVMELTQLFSVETLASLSAPSNSPAIHSNSMAPLGNTLYSTPAANPKLIQTSVHAAAKTDPFSAPSPQNLPPPITQQTSPQLDRHTAHAIPNSFPSLETKSVEELQQLLNQPAEYDKFFTSLDEVATVLKLKEELEREAADVNAGIAAQEAAIDAMLKELEQMQQSTREVTAKVNEARIRQRAVAEQLSGPALRRLLTIACEHAEQEVQSVSFEGVTGADVAERLKRYMEVRKKFHWRNSKLAGEKH